MRQGQCVIDLSTNKGHTSRFLMVTLLIVSMHLEENNLSMKENTNEFILSPTCSLFRGSTVNHISNLKPWSVPHVASLSKKKLMCVQKAEQLRCLDNQV